MNGGFLESAAIDGYYIGACLVSYDTSTRRGRYAAAGHPHGLIFQRDGEGYRLREHLGIQSPMLGMNEASRFKEVEFQLGQDELLLLVSDGIIDSPCAGKSPFGIAGIAGFFAGYSGSTPLEALFKEVRRQGASSPPVDDVSAVLLAPALAPEEGFPL